MLGRGGFGKVYLAHPVVPTRQKEVFVVKTVNLAVALSGSRTDADARKMELMILHEADILRNLKHDHVVKVYGAFIGRYDKLGIEGDIFNIAICLPIIY